LHWGVAWTRAAQGLVAAGAVALALVSGGSSTDPRTPAGLAGMPPPFLGTAVVGGGGLTAAVDAYGDVVDLRAPGPAGRALIDNPADRQAAGTVAAATGIVPRVRVGGGPARPLWRADSVAQRYLPGTSVLLTTARFGQVRVEIVDAAFGQELARILTVSAPPDERPMLSFGVELEPGSSCRRETGAGRITLVCGAGGAGSAAARVVSRAIAADRRWLSFARPLAAGAPAWAGGMYRRSLLTLRALTDRRTGAVAAGARDGWAYVWPRDAGTAALALAAGGYRPEARRVARFLLRLDLGAAARFHGNGSPVPGRGAQGDAAGWVAVAARAAGIADTARQTAKILAGDEPVPWRHRSDYWEGGPGDYLANALAARSDVSEFSRHIRRGNSDTPWAPGLVRVSGNPESGLDSAAAWAVRPFSQPRLYPAARATLSHLVAHGTRFGITPAENWLGGDDPWSAPTAWSAWSLAVLGERGEALRLMQALRRAATPAGALPERVDAETGIPASTTPLAWSHAFAILALRQLWP
jgi:glycosyl hydrolase family 15